ncbi:hypothetical protein [Haloferula sp. BvORR071]|uniref:hypothetical protein n=1 Tax=Haloferula sp. BvORR071 TaxID=1396141 RepID=UPI000554ACCF|nr:hypothetical protein [Haloferula sp. BvORR071]
MNAKVKRLLLIALVPVFAAIGVMVWISRERERPRGPALPAFDSAQLSRHDITPREIVEQKLPAADLGRLRSELEAAVFDREPMKWVYLGQLELLVGGAKVLAIDLFRGAGDFLPVRIGKQYYRLRSPGVLGELLKSKDLPPD